MPDQEIARISLGQGSGPLLREASVVDRTRVVQPLDHLGARSRVDVGPFQAVG